ncbi:hypothetical protein D3C78_1473770 [compost metagenome]
MAKNPPLTIDVKDNVGGVRLTLPCQGEQALMNPAGVFSNCDIGFVEASPNHLLPFNAEGFEISLVTHDHAALEIPDGYGVGHCVDHFTQHFQFMQPCFIQARRRCDCIRRFDVCHQSRMPGSIDKLQE